MMLPEYNYLAILWCIIWLRKIDTQKRSFRQKPLENAPRDSVISKVAQFIWTYGYITLNGHNFIKKKNL